MTKAESSDKEAAPASGIRDPEAFAHNLARMIEEAGKAAANYLGPREKARTTDDFDGFVTEAVRTLVKVGEYWMGEPERAAQAQNRLLAGYLGLWASSLKRMMGEPAEPAAEPQARDKRFLDPAWRSNQFFDFIKQFYLITSRWAEAMAEEAEGLDPHTRQKAAFYVKQVASALSPSNFALTNPEILRQTLASDGDNLVRGLHMLAEDIKAGHGTLKIRQSDASQFKLGETLAATPGKVIHQNDICQLIQYRATTKTVLKRPLLIVPPWINKFYILDLAPEKSFIRWCVDQGHTVFVVSWVNPDRHQAKKSFAHYMREGIFESLDVIEAVTGESAGQRGRLLRRRHAAVDRARLCRGHRRHAHRLGDALRHPGRFLPGRRPQGLRRRGADRRGREADGRARLSRRPQHACRLQHAAARRPHLALCDRQLFQGRAAGALRPALLEFRHDAHARGQPFLLSAQLLSR